MRAARCFSSRRVQPFGRVFRRFLDIPSRRCETFGREVTHHVFRGPSKIENPKSKIADVVRRTLPNGARLQALENPTSETTVVSGLLLGGATCDPAGLEGLTLLSSNVADRATARLTYEQIYERVDSLGAVLSIGCGTHAIGFYAKCLSRDWPTVADLLIEMLREASFPDAELDRARGELLTHLDQLETDTRSVAERELGHLVYPVGHPLRHPTHGYRPVIESARRDDLVACHARLFRPDALLMTLVGNVPAAQALDGLAERLGDWPRPAEALPSLDLAACHPDQAQRRAVPVPDKTQVDIALGFKGIPRTHPNYYALDQATLILGGMALMGRLGDNVRDRQGLAYYAFARMREGFGDGLWGIRAGVNPANAERAIASALDEIRRMQDQPVTDQEIADVQSYLVGVLPLRIETNDGLAGALNSIELYGLGADYIARYPDIIRSVTRDAIQRAAQSHLTAERYSLAIAGPVGP